MKESEITPEIRGILEGTRRHYRGYIETSAKVISEIAIQSAKTFNINPLQEIQQICDRNGMFVKFVAIPHESEVLRHAILVFEEGKGEVPSDVRNYNVEMPHTGENQYPYWLWSICNKPLEYADLLAKLETTPEENFKRLSQTGMLTIKKNSQLSKMANADQN